VNRLATHGLGGVGKTRAAIEYAWRYASDFTARLCVSAASGAELRTNVANLVGVQGMIAGGPWSTRNWPRCSTGSTPIPVAIDRR
jgi:hypothetical protein